MRLRSTAIVTQGVVEPVSLSEAKNHLRFTPEMESDDQYIVGLIATARALIEKRLGVALALKQVRASYDNEEPPIDWRLAASFMPTLTIQSTQYRAALGIVEPTVTLPLARMFVDSTHPVAVAVDGAAVNPATYTVDSDSQPSVIRFKDMPYVPARGVLTVTYWAGPAPGARIAPQLRSAMLLLIGHLYANREAVVTDGSQPVVMPLAFDTLLASESITGIY